MTTRLNFRSAQIVLLAMATLTINHFPWADVQGAENFRQQAARASAEGDHNQAAQLLTLAIQAQPEDSLAYYSRGREYFRLGKVKASVADFNKHVELSPELESRQWERGIALYYAGEFEKGAAQFALYQSFHDQDVENSTWRYLCMARSVGVEKARATMLPITNDPRVPMMQIFELYRGKLQPDDVLKAAQAGDPAAADLAGRLFYAHLYLGLFYEANGNPALAKKYILLAADEQAKQSKRINTYMWDVARVHAEILKLAKVPATP